MAYWLVPAEPMRGWFVWQIAQFVSRYNAPVFEPHVTVYASRKENADPQGTLKEALTDCAPFPLLIRDIQCSDEFTKTVFVQFEPGNPLSEINRKLREVSGAKDDYELNPHLSLIYKQMPAAERTELAKLIKLPFNEVVFDTAMAVVCPTTPITSREDVENWHVVASQQLTG
ncbi:MAG: hypothetical protein QOH88_2032 [Verrucomicrobiota bacterium]